MGSYFPTYVCYIETLRQAAHSFYESSEFSGLGAGSHNKLVALDRGLLNREPDASGFSGWYGYLNGGGLWSSVIDSFINSSEFAALIPAVCSGGP